MLKSSLNTSSTTFWLPWFKLASSCACFSLWSMDIKTTVFMLIIITVYCWWSSFHLVHSIWCFIHLSEDQWWSWNMFSTTRSSSLIQTLHSLFHSLIWIWTLQQNFSTCTCFYSSTQLSMPSSISLLLKSSLRFLTSTCILYWMTSWRKGSSKKTMLFTFTTRPVRSNGKLDQVSTRPESCSIDFIEPSMLQWSSTSSHSCLCLDTNTWLNRENTSILLTEWVKNNIQHHS